MVDVRFTPDPEFVAACNDDVEPEGLDERRPIRQDGPRVFDWCAPGRSPRQHRKCRGWYRRKVTRSAVVITGNDDPDGELVVCGCPDCNHNPKGGRRP